MVKIGKAEGDVMKRLKLYCILITIIVVLSSVIFLFVYTSENSQKMIQWNTSMGTMRAELRGDLVPMTVQNFINLSEKGFYTDLIFHRVISGFMIQDGCPLGTGYGGPGYSFDDEFDDALRHNSAGILSMANAGPNTNGSQYFITLDATAWLDDAHAVFGRILDGMDVLFAIGDVETDGNDRPIVDVNLTIGIVESNPELTLINPESEFGAFAGTTINIEWESDFVADVKIEFSNNNGNDWITLTDSIPSDNEAFEWNVKRRILQERTRLIREGERERKGFLYFAKFVGAASVAAALVIISLFAFLRAPETGIKLARDNKRTEMRIGRAEPLRVGHRDNVKFVSTGINIVDFSYHLNGLVYVGFIFKWKAN